MRYRVLGRTGIQVSEIGYGGWGVGGGWGPRDDEEAMRALRKALDLGVNFFDSALGYGGGHSDVEANCAVSDGKLLSGEDLEALRAHAFVHGWKYPWSQVK